ncbi:hypothetical protein [Bremerella sp. P1]|uniref:hypothetical protein n=1 Tax=Bremerella sp. P1 TaxID=3026424 RepID=UPI002368EB23|nr:hypothetical protein [Bremerella sp. P1]WDI43579.1 hypothetical protein PSR63_06420 [Bremerella sp. P1]
MRFGKTFWKIASVGLVACVLLPGGLPPRTSVAQENAQKNQSFDAAATLQLARQRLAAPVAAVDQASTTEVSNLMPCVVYLSLSRPTQTAVVSFGLGASVEAATRAAADKLRAKVTSIDLKEGRLRVDVAVRLNDEAASEGRGPIRLINGPYGLWFARDHLLYLPEDGRPQSLSGGNGTRPFSHESWVESSSGDPVELYFGNRLTYEVSPESLLAAATSGGDYLVRHIRLDGKFDYNYDPQTNQANADYNFLRHAGTCYALLELQEAVNQHAEQSGKPKPEQIYLQCAKRGIDFLLTHHCHELNLPGHDHQLRVVVSPDREAKLGGAALIMLAMLKYREVSGDDVWLPELRQFGRFTEFLQQPDGHFFSSYHLDDPDFLQYESPYYPGEAMLALSRLAMADPEGPWFEIVERGADYLINVRDKDVPLAELPHDHWFCIAMNEFTKLTDELRFANHAKKISDAMGNLLRVESPQPEWIGSYYMPPRSTSTATRAEAVVAFTCLAKRNHWDHMPYMQQLKLMVGFQLRCQIIPENVMYLPRPDQALGGFRASLEEWEVQIDYVQHNISSLLGLRRLLLEENGSSTE